MTETVPADSNKTAVIYLRVSTKRQVNKGYNPDGYSLPAQQIDCETKALQLGATVVRVFVDRGESARTADRPEFQKMLAFLAENPVSYLIVHKLDRWARDRTDDVLLNMQIQATGARLVSAKENIDGTPAGKMLHGILATMNEFYSSNLSTEVLKGMNQKAQDGGTSGRAPVGYFNSEERTADGRAIRAVTVDPERGPLIALAFELYATGDYSLSSLVAELTRRGLKSRPNKNHDGKAFSLGQMSRILHNPYYVGDVTWHGVTYVGRHQALVTRQLFEDVQIMLEQHNLAGERSRVHHHYLKGTVFCGRCSSRLSLDKAKNNYMYFYCLGRARRTGCDLPYIEVGDVEDLVAKAYDEFEVQNEDINYVREGLRHYLDAQSAEREEQAQKQRLRLKKIKDQGAKLLRAHLADAVPLELLKEEQDRLKYEQLQVETLLASLETDTSETLSTFEEIASTLLPLNRQSYTDLDSTSRRMLNQLLITHALIDTETPPSLQLTELGEAVQSIRQVPERRQRATRSHGAATQRTGSPRNAENPQLTEVAAGSRNLHLERVTGIEPASTAWEAVVLPMNYTRVALRGQAYTGWVRLEGLGGPLLCDLCC
jgi:site-specific DNA recombinase